MNRLNKIFSLIIFLSIVYLTVPSTAFAAIVNASSCSQPDVQAAINFASNGDTINIPRGSCTWSQGVAIPSTKGLTIKGAGIGQTIISDNLVSHNWAQALFSIEIATEIFTRVTGFTFFGAAGDTYGSIFINSKTGTVGGNNFRIDNCHFANLRGRGIRINGYAYGVIDHCTFDAPNNESSQGVSIIGDGNAAWDRNQTLGTKNAVYIEDCTFNYSYLNDGALDAYHGARYVFRRNTINGTVVAHHGNDSGNYRSTHSFEIYNNSFNNTGNAIYTVMRSRGGSGVVFNNTITGNWNDFFILSNYRSCPYFEGSHTGTESATLTDLNILTNCSPDGFNNKGTINEPYCLGNPVVDNSYYIYNLTDGSNCKITAHTNKTVTCTLTSGATNVWKTGDKYAINYFYNSSGLCTGYCSADGNEPGSEGYSCLDQNGRTTGQILSPIYFWGNNYKGNDLPIVSKGNGCARQKTLHIQVNRDYFDNTEKPGYTPYTYPHPLRGLGHQLSGGVVVGGTF